MLVTGGSGYYGTVVADRFLARGDKVRIFDLEAPTDPTDAEVVIGDVRDRDALRAACDGVDVIMNNVAQVPLAKDHELFWTVNVVGTANVLLAARDAGVDKVVHTSSSAIFGIPEHNPVDESTPGRPLEAYGQAKLHAEVLCHEAAARDGVDVTIVRPRTILGHGRLGIMAILFEFVAEGAPVFVFGKGDNRYQFVHANDLADASIRAADRPGPTTYNIGAREMGTMRETLQALVDHAATGSSVRSLPTGPGRRRHEEPLGPRAPAVRPVPLAALRRVALLRHDQGRVRAGLAVHLLQRLDADRVLRVVPRPPSRARRAEGFAPPVTGEARRAGAAQATAVMTEAHPAPAEAHEDPGWFDRLDAPGRRRVVVLVAFALVAIPLIVAVVALHSPRWYPIGDLAQTELRVRDVGTGDSPMIGLVGRLGTLTEPGSHPGPLSFWLLAPVYRLLGTSAFALIVSTVFLHLVALGLALWIAFRRAGPWLAVGVARRERLAGTGLRPRGAHDPVEPVPAGHLVAGAAARAVVAALRRRGHAADRGAGRVVLRPDPHPVPRPVRWADRVHRCPHRGPHLAPAPASNRRRTAAGTTAGDMSGGGCWGRRSSVSCSGCPRSSSSSPTTPATSRSSRTP